MTDRPYRETRKCKLCGKRHEVTSACCPSCGMRYLIDPPADVEFVTIPVQPESVRLLMAAARAFDEQTAREYAKAVANGIEPPPRRYAAEDFIEWIRPDLTWRDPEPMPDREYPDGCLGSYHKGCRCRRCKDANTEYARRARARRAMEGKSHARPPMELLPQASVSDGEDR